MLEMRKKNFDSLTQLFAMIDNKNLAELKE